MGHHPTLCVLCRTMPAGSTDHAMVRLEPFAIEVLYFMAGRLTIDE